MTLRARNLLVIITFVLLGAALLLFAFLCFKIPFNSELITRAVSESEGRYLVFRWSLVPYTAMVNVVNSGASLLVAIVTAFLFLRNFRKTTTPQLFFLVFFWISLGFELTRTVSLYLIANDSPESVQILISRLSLAGKLFGACALFSASLYSAGMKLQQLGYLFGAIVIVAAALAYLIPLDEVRRAQALMFTPPEGFSLDIFRLSAGLLTVMNFVKYAFSARDSREFIVVVPILALLLGQELLYVSNTWLISGLAWASMAIGTVWLLRRFTASHLWY